MIEPPYLFNTISSYNLTLPCSILETNLFKIKRNLTDKSINEKFNVNTNGIGSKFYINSEFITIISDTNIFVEHIKNNTENSNILKVFEISDYMKENGFLTVLYEFKETVGSYYFNNTNMINYEEINKKCTIRGNKVFLSNVLISNYNMDSNSIVNFSNISDMFFFKNSSYNISVVNFELKNIKSNNIYIGTLNVTNDDIKTENTILPVKYCKNNFKQQKDIDRLNIINMRLNSPINYKAFKNKLSDYVKIDGTFESISVNNYSVSSKKIINNNTLVKLIDSKINTKSINIKNFNDFDIFLTELCPIEYLKKDMIVNGEAFFCLTDRNSYYSYINNSELLTFVKNKGGFDEFSLVDNENYYFSEYDYEKKAILINVASIYDINLDFSANSFGQTFSNIMDLIYNLTYLDVDKINSITGLDGKVSNIKVISNTFFIVPPVVIVDSFTPIIFSFINPVYNRISKTMQIYAENILTHSFINKNIVFINPVYNKDLSLNNMNIQQPYVYIEKMSNIGHAYIVNPIYNKKVEKIPALNQTLTLPFDIPTITSECIETKVSELSKKDKRKYILYNGFSYKKEDYYRMCVMKKISSSISKIPYNVKIDEKNVCPNSNIEDDSSQNSNDNSVCPINIYCCEINDECSDNKDNEDKCMEIPELPEELKDIKCCSDEDTGIYYNPNFSCKDNTFISDKDIYIAPECKTNMSIDVFKKIDNQKEQFSYEGNSMLLCSVDENNVVLYSNVDIKFTQEEINGRTKIKWGNYSFFINKISLNILFKKLCFSLGNFLLLEALEALHDTTIDEDGNKITENYDDLTQETKNMIDDLSDEFDRIKKIENIIQELSKDRMKYPNFEPIHPYTTFNGVDMSEPPFEISEVIHYTPDKIQNPSSGGGDASDISCILRDSCEPIDIDAENIFSSNNSYDEENYNGDENGIPGVYIGTVDIEAFADRISTDDKTGKEVKIPVNALIKIDIVMGGMKSLVDDEGHDILSVCKTSECISKNIADYTDKIIPEEINSIGYEKNDSKFVVPVLDEIKEYAFKDKNNNDIVVNKVKNVKIGDFGKVVVKSFTGDDKAPYSTIPVASDMVCKSSYNTEEGKLKIGIVKELFLAKGQGKRITIY